VVQDGIFTDKVPSSNVLRGNSTQNGLGLEHIDENTDEEDISDEDERPCCARKNRSIDIESNSSHGLTADNNGANEIKTKRSLTTADVLRQRVVLLATGTYGVLCVPAILIEETLPLFLKAQVADGGFGFDSAQIGSLLSLSGIFMLVFTSYVLPRLARGSKFWLFRVGVLGSIPVALSMPFIALLNRVAFSKFSHTAQTYIIWTILPLVIILKSVFSTFMFNATMIFVNHSVYDEFLGG
jgi:hypothetical protein